MNQSVPRQPLRSNMVKDCIRKLPNIKMARDYTNNKIDRLREFSLEHKISNDILIGTFGSYARREASSESDLDFFVICRTANQKAVALETLKKLQPQLIAIAGHAPSTTGAFGIVEDFQAILSNIGGNDDHNKNITRRVLFLLEGEWISNAPFFEEIRRSLIEKYIRNTITAHQIALFLLNDIIRYYKTICCDFEFKTTSEDNPKPWGTRNIKLVFSRKLLYFSGVLAIAETAQRTYQEKIRIINDLLSLPVIDRLITVCGDQAVHALELYDEFLFEFAKPEVRAALDDITEADRHTEIFRRLKDNGHHFSWRLLNLLRQTYDPSHPIHRAIIL